LVAVVAAACVWAHGTPVAVVALTLLMLATPGLGINCVVDFPAGVRRLPTILLASLSWCTGVGLLSAYSGFMSAAGLFVLLSAPGVGGAMLLLGRGHPTWGRSFARGTTVGSHRANGRSGAVGAVHLDDESAGGLVSPHPNPTRHRKPTHGRRWALVAALTVGSLLAWVYAVHTGRSERVGAYGLIPNLGYPFLLAVLLSVGVGLIGVLLLPRSPGVALACLLTVCIELAVTPALFTSHLLGGWNYKHVGVVDLIATGRGLDGSHDLFQAWPGFFATAADLVAVAGGSPTAYANWATFIFLAVSAVALYSATRTLFTEPAIATLAVLVYLCTGWAGQMYYSPQTFAFAMSMLVLAVLLPVLLDTRATHARDRFRAALASWARRNPAGVGRRPLAPAETAVIGTLVVIGFACIVTTHQLTPYMLLLQLLPFVVLSWVGRRWQFGYLLIAVFALGYLLLHFDALGTDSLFSGFSTRNFSGMPAGSTSAAQDLAAGASRGIAIWVWGGAAVAALSYWRCFGQVVVPAALAFMPMALVLFQSYGGEAIYRVWLFSAPWCAVILAWRLYDLRRRRVAGVLLLGALSFISFFGAAQATNFGMFPMVRITSDEIDASSWFYEHAPDESRLVLVMASFPQRLDHDYVDHAGDVPAVNEPTLADDPQFARGGLDAMPAADLASYVTRLWGRDSYLAISRSMVRMNDYYGLATAGAVQRLEDRLSSSPDWTVAYRNRDAIILRPR
jgi:hypothetical protein